MGTKPHIRKGKNTYSSGSTSSRIQIHMFFSVNTVVTQLIRAVGGDDAIVKVQGDR